MTPHEIARIQHIVRDERAVVTAAGAARDDAIKRFAAAETALFYAVAHAIAHATAFVAEESEAKR